MRPSVPVPERMARLPRDERGYAIPWMVFRDSDGRAHFTINDENRRQKIIAKDLCSICAQPLLRGRWFVGGPGSAFHENGAYRDPPMHYECACYALQVCPYLAAPRYSKNIEARTLKPEHVPPLLIDPTIDPARPELFVAVMATGQRHIHVTLMGVRIVQFLKPRRPYSRVEFWCHGQRVEMTERQRVAFGVDL